MFLTSLLSCSALLAMVSQKLSREEASQVIDQYLLPKTEYGDRIRYSGQALGLSDGLVDPNDPATSLTYGEFPLESLDTLLDAAVQHLTNTHDHRIVDVGSGYGRLCLYMALTRNWKVDGIEISALLHAEAIKAQTIGIQREWLKEATNGNEVAGRLDLHQGPAADFREILGKADMIFCYSTVFETQCFDPEICAMVLSNEWNELFSHACQPGCVIVTTDRALDPRRGWKLLDRLEVRNPEVMDSTGYIQRLER